MGCCVGFEEAREVLEKMVSSYFDDYKLFTISREVVSALVYKVRVGVVVLPQEGDSSRLFEALLALNTSVESCIKVRNSTIDKQGSKMIELFVVEIEIRL